MLTFLLMVVIAGLILYIVKTKKRESAGVASVKFKTKTDVNEKPSTIVEEPSIDPKLSELPDDEIMLFSSEFKNKYVLQEQKSIGKGKMLPLFGTHITVGRSAENQIVLCDSMVSDKHMLIEIIPGYPVKITDLDSSNGTFINGARIQEGWLSVNDVIQVGHIELKFTRED